MSIRFRGKIRLGFYRETTYCSPNCMRSVKKQHLTEHPAHKYSGEQMRATACVVACSPPTVSICFGRWRLGSSLSASLEWAEEALKRHARVSDGDAAIRVLRFSPYFGLIAWFSSRLADRAGGKFVLATAMIFFWGPTAGVRCAMACIRGRGCCPGRHP